jgi:hypothetical protein
MEHSLPNLDWVAHALSLMHVARWVAHTLPWMYATWIAALRLGPARPAFATPDGSAKSAQFT